MQKKHSSRERDGKEQMVDGRAARVQRTGGSRMHRHAGKKHAGCRQSREKTEKKRRQWKVILEDLDSWTKYSFIHGEVTTDRYGRKIPKHAHGTANLQNHTSSAITVVEKTLELYDRIINPDLLIRRIYVTACHVRTEQEAQKEQTYEQMSLFDFAEETEEQKAQKQALQKEKQMQKAMLSIKQRYGKNAILKGTNFKEGATMRQRNGQIGGHRA